MFESDSICLQVLSHWTRCEKGSWLCSYILKSPVCGTDWTLIRYVVFLHALFHDFSVHFMHGPWIGYFDIEICLSEGWCSRFFNPWLRCWFWSSRASFSTARQFSGLRPTMSSFNLWSSFSAFPSPWCKHVNEVFSKLLVSLVLILFPVKHGFKNWNLDADSFCDNVILYNILAWLVSLN